MIEIAVTGANGFIGSWICNCLKENHKIRAIVRQNADTSLLDKEITVFPVSYDNLEQLTTAIDGCEILIHCAALTKAKNWIDFKKANIDLTMNLLEICQQSKSLRQFIFMSSQAAGGMPQTYSIAREEDNYPVQSMYGMSKRIAEDKLKKYSTINYTILRPVSVFGPGERDFLQVFRMVKKGFLPIIGKKASYMNLIYIKTLIDFVKLIILNEQAYKQTYFVHDGKIYTKREFLDIIRLLINPAAKVFIVPVFAVRILAEINSLLALITGKVPALNRLKAKELTGRYWLCSIDNAGKLGFNPDSDISQSIKETFDWYAEKGWL